MAKDIFLRTFRALEKFAPSQTNPTGSWSLFFLIFALIFMGLKYVYAFKENKGARFLIAAIFAYFAARSSFTVEIMEKMIPRISVVLVSIVAFIFALLILAPEGAKYLSKLPVMIILLIVMFIVLWSSLPVEEVGFFQNVVGGYKVGGIFLSIESMGALIFVVIFITIGIWLLIGGGEDGTTLKEILNKEL